MAALRLELAHHAGVHVSRPYPVGEAQKLARRGAAIGRDWPRLAADMIERQGLSRLVPLATLTAVTVSVALPIIEVGRIAVTWSSTAGGGPGILAVLATACYLPLQARHVVYAARGSRPPRAMWTLTAMAIIVLGAVPFIGIGWLSALHSVALSVLILLPTPWSLGIFAGLVVAPLPLAFALGAPDLGAYYSVVVAWRTLAPFTVIWLVSAIRQLETARQTLAQDAVTRERLRIDAELRWALGGSLEKIATDAERASALVRQSPSTVEELLQATVERSRHTLAEVRRVVNSYQHLSLRAELDAAAALLNAAGIKTRVVFPDGDFPSSVEASLHAELRSATARLLRDEVTRSCVIVVAQENGRPRLELRPGTGPRPTARNTT